MAAATRLLASAVVGGLMVGGAGAQVAAWSPVPPAARVAASAVGSIHGVVRDERGAPVAGVVVSALGASTTVAVTDKDGRFEFGTLSPGPYLLRAHLSGYIAPRVQTAQVSPSARTVSAIAVRRVGSLAPILVAGVGAPVAVDAEAAAESESAQSEDQGETAWRLRHARRGVLRDVAVPFDLLADDAGGGSGPDRWTVADVLGRAVGSPARAATSFFAATPFSGQVNLLTTGSFNRPEQLFSTDNLPRSIAYVHLTAPVGDQADWAVRGTLTQADISSWMVAGSYSTRAPARHRYDVGLSYSAERDDQSNLVASRDIGDGGRTAGSAYAYDSFAISPSVTLSYGAVFARYDYLDGRSLLSPRGELTVMPVEGLRLSASVARRALAPGAEEFLPPGETAIWLPPQRTFSSLEGRRLFDAERTTHVELAVERDFGTSTLALRAFRQHVDDQLVTIFGSDPPGRPAAKIGHYLVGNVGAADASGCSAAFRTVILGRVHGSVEYTMANAQMTPSGDLGYLMVLAPTVVRSAREHVHDLSTSIETQVPETSTRVLVLYRVNSGFARPSGAARSALDGRFDVQVRQSLSFMNFSNARWEMLLAVRNFFYGAGVEQSVYDELFVVRPPKRVLGGVTLSF